MAYNINENKVCYYLICTTYIYIESTATIKIKFKIKIKNYDRSIVHETLLRFCVPNCAYSVRYPNEVAYMNNADACIKKMNIIISI